MLFQYEEPNLTETAECVIKFNRFATGYTVSTMKERILDVVRDYPARQTGYVRTYGFVISFYDFEGKPSVKFSIDSNTLISWMKERG